MLRSLVIAASMLIAAPASACDLRHLPWESYAADAAIIGDSYTTADLTHRPGLHEGNPIYGRHPSYALIAGAGAARIALNTATTCYLEDRNPRLARIFSILSLGVNGGYFAANLHLYF